MAAGFARTAFSLYQMTSITLQMDSHRIILSGFIQGLGIGFTLVPLSTATFARLAPRLRNIGGSVGISIVQALLTHGSAQAHAQLAAVVAPGNRGLINLPPGLGPDTASGLAMLNAEVSRQAALIGYVGDFSIMMIVTLLTIPLLLLIRRPGSVPSAAPAEVPH